MVQTTERSLKVTQMETGAQRHLPETQNPKPHSWDNGLALEQIPEDPQVAHSTPGLENL